MPFANPAPRLARSGAALRRSMLRAVDPHVQRALAAIDEAEREVAAAGPIEITEQHARDIAAVMALPQNQDGADKSHIWRIYEYCRTHFAKARLT